MQALLAQFSDHIGIIGVLLTLIAYGALSIGKMDSESLAYSLLNLIGSWLILVSLMYSWNLSSVIIEAAWIMISIIGIYRFYINRNKNKNNKDKKLTNLYVINNEKNNSSF